MLVWGSLSKILTEVLKVKLRLLSLLQLVFCCLGQMLRFASLIAPGKPEDTIMENFVYSIFSKG